jgi:hypothetical protein
VLGGHSAPDAEHRAFCEWLPKAKEHHDWQFGGLIALQNAADVDAYLRYSSIMLVDVVEATTIDFSCARAETPKTALAAIPIRWRRVNISIPHDQRADDPAAIEAQPAHAPA